jgi:hypothetical protein
MVAEMTTTLIRIMMEMVPDETSTFFLYHASVSAIVSIIYRRHLTGRR